MRSRNPRNVCEIPSPEAQAPWKTEPRAVDRCPPALPSPLLAAHLAATSRRLADRSLLSCPSCPLPKIYIRPIKGQKSQFEEIKQVPELTRQRCWRDQMGVKVTVSGRRVTSWHTTENPIAGQAGPRREPWRCWEVAGF